VVANGVAVVDAVGPLSVVGTWTGGEWRLGRHGGGGGVTNGGRREIYRARCEWGVTV
jgi:hypothetical protein